MKDIATNSDGSLKTKDGDFVLEDSTGVFIERILLAQKGSYVFNPLVGVGISDFIEDEDSLKNRNSLRRRIKLQMEFNGIEVRKVTIKSLSNPIIEV